MPISGIILDTVRGRGAAVAATVGARAEVDVERVIDDQVVVTLDTPTLEADREILQGLERTDGVTSTHVVFFNAEDCV